MGNWLELLGVVGTWLALVGGSTSGAYLGARSRQHLEYRYEVHELLRGLSYAYDPRSTSTSSFTALGVSNQSVSHAYSQYCLSEIRKRTRLLRLEDRALFEAVCRQIPASMAKAAYRGSVFVETALRSPEASAGEDTALELVIKGVDVAMWEEGWKNLRYDRYSRSLEDFRKHLEYYLGVPTIGQRLSHSARQLRSWPGWLSSVREDVAGKRTNPASMNSG